MGCVRRGEGVGTAQPARNTSSAVHSAAFDAKDRSLRGVTRGRGTTLTGDYPVDLVRDFTASAPDRMGSHIRTRAGWVYPRFVRRLAPTTLRSSLAIDALETVCHLPAQKPCGAPLEREHIHRLARRLGGKRQLRSPYETSGLYKTELIRNRGPWRDLDHTTYATLEYIDWFNHRRLHSESPQYHTPPPPNSWPTTAKPTLHTTNRPNNSTVY